MIDQKDIFTEFSAFVLLTTTTNTVGWGNKLVIVFAAPLPKLYLDSKLLNYLP